MANLGGGHRRLVRMVCVGALMVALAPSSPSAHAVTGTHPSNQWAPVPFDDLSGDTYQHISAIEVYHDALYLGVQTPWPAQIWRTPDGVRWEGVITGTTETAQQLGGIVMDFAVVEDALFASTYTSGRGGAIWRTGDGDHWEPVTPLYDSQRWYFDLAEFNGKLYAHLSLGDTTVYSPNQVVTTGADGHIWAVAFEPDFAITSLEAIGDALYAGGVRALTQQACLWRFDGAAWSDVSAEIQTSTEGRVLTVAAFGGQLYAVVNERDPDQHLRISLWRSTAGEHWARVVSDDLDGVRASGSNVIKAALGVYRNALFLFTYDLGSGAVWRSPDGEQWDPVAPDGWISGNARGVGPSGVAVFRDQLWAGVVDTQGPGEVMLYLPFRHPLPAVLNAAGTPQLP